MVLVNNKRKKRAMSKGNGGDSDFEKSAGSGRSLYRPYNLNFLPGLGACCKQAPDDSVFLAAVARYNTLVDRIKEMKAAYAATVSDSDTVKENVGDFGEKNYTRDSLTVKDMAEADVVVAATGAVISKAALKTLVNGATVLANQKLIDFNAALKVVTTKKPANSFTDNLPNAI